MTQSSSKYSSSRSVPVKHLHRSEGLQVSCYLARSVFRRRRIRRRPRPASGSVRCRRSGRSSSPRARGRWHRRRPAAAPPGSVAVGSPSVDAQARFMEWLLIHVRLRGSDTILIVMSCVPRFKIVVNCGYPCLTHVHNTCIPGICHEGFVRLKNLNFFICYERPRLSTGFSYHRSGVPECRIQAHKYSNIGPS